MQSALTIAAFLVILLAPCLVAMRSAESNDPTA
jgi:hypothetical protein